MEFLRTDYGSDDDDEVRGDDGASSNYLQDPRESPFLPAQQHTVYSKDDKAMYMNTEECVVVDKHMVNLFYTSIRKPFYAY